MTKAELPKTARTLARKAAEREASSTDFNHVGVRLAARCGMDKLGNAASLDLEYLSDLLAEVAKHDDQLRTAARRVEDRAARVSMLLDEQAIVNSLGEIQGSALDVDLHCALRGAAIEAYARGRHHVIRCERLSEDAIVQFEKNAGWTR